MSLPYAPYNPCLPMVVSAFVLNEAVASDPDARIAPIAQPNYTFLRLDTNPSVIQNDVQDPVDLHYSFPASNNPRVYDLGTRKVIPNRLGVYLTWTLPRVYRSGTAAAPHSQGKTPAEKNAIRQKKGFAPVNPQDSDYSSPDFRSTPTRWLVVRLIDKASIQDQVSPDVAAKLECVAWVIDSDLKTDLESIPYGRDLQVDYSPFITASTENDNDLLRKQAEVFIGRKEPLDAWSEVAIVDGPDRPQLSVLNASNPIFADYQPHNSNVFSMVDNFDFVDDSGKSGILQHARASYYVVGWHSKLDEDPFYMTADALTTLKERLDNLNLTVINSDNDSTVQNWENNSQPARTVVHGAVYNVGWNAQKMPPSPAQTAGKNLKAQEPIAVGTTATDTILSYVHAHKDIDSGETEKLEDDIWALGTLLLAQDDGVDQKAEAQDLLYSYNFERIDGGMQWHMAGEPGNSQSFVPDQSQIEILRQINDAQVALDNALRTEKQLKWDLFSEWWRFVGSKSQSDLVSDTQNNMTDIINRLNTLRGPPGAKYPVYCINSFQNQIAELSGQIPIVTGSKKGAQAPFYTRKDPTLLVAGIASSWPVDFLNKLKIRIGSQVSYADSNKYAQFQSLIDKITSKLPGGNSGISGAVPALLKEFFSLSGPLPPIPTGSSQTEPHDPAPSDIMPLYHDCGPLPTSRGPWRDQWGDAQPWWPLFLEWQAEYYHIPFADWELAPTASSKWEYQVKQYPDLPLWKQGNIDKRTLSGRINLLPQPSFSLGTAITRLFQNIKDLPISSADRDDLEAHLPSIPFLSSPMSGLTDHLLTLSRGTHIKPSQRPSGTQATAMDAAVFAVRALQNQSTKAAFTSDQLSLIGQESGRTPYGELVRLSDNSTACPLKPATHGQFRFTQINIIDRFGQAICALNPDPTELDKTPHIAPILSEVYSPQPWISPSQTAGIEPNVVERNFKPAHNKKCEFAQLPPGINQDSRLNFTFVFPNPNPPAKLQLDNYWLPCGDYDVPIWGWVLLNYVDYGLQFFDSNGKFYREVRLGGPLGQVISSPWKPFGPPPSLSSEDTRQLDHLLAQFTAEGTGPAYLDQFFRMIELALGNINPPPNMYASYLQSVIGKPFALTTFGLSLELATDALTVQTKTKNMGIPPLTLLTPTDPSQHQYQFPVKLGDAERPFDGLVGYWNSSAITPGETDFSYLYTYFDPPPGPKPTSPTTVAICKENIPKISPFWVSPDITTNDVSGSKTYAPKSPSTITAGRVAKLSIFSAILDPFIAIHAYSGILPVASLQLPHWTVETAMRNMTAFFHYGPLLLSTDVPSFFLPEYEAGNAAGAINTSKPVGIPALKSAKWAWLQPYDETPRPHPGGAETQDSGGRGELEDQSPLADKYTKYMALSLQAVDQKPRYENGPYTAVEGYLQLTEPLMQAEVAAPSGIGLLG